MLRVHRGYTIAARERQAVLNVDRAAHAAIPDERRRSRARQPDFPPARREKRAENGRERNVAAREHRLEAGRPLLVVLDHQNRVEHARTCALVHCSMWMQRAGID